MPSDRRDEKLGFTAIVRRFHFSLIVDRSSGAPLPYFEIPESRMANDEPGSWQLSVSATPVPPGPHSCWAVSSLSPAHSSHSHLELVLRNLDSAEIEIEIGSGCWQETLPSMPRSTIFRLREG